MKKQDKRPAGPLQGGPLAFVAVVLCVALFAACTSSNVQSASGNGQSLLSSSAEMSAALSESTPASISASSTLPSFSAINFTPDEIARLDGLLADWASVSEEEEENGHTVAVYFKDITSGLEYTYNPETKFLIASLNKAPYAMFLYHLVEEGTASLEETFYVTPEAVENSLENSGRIKNEELPRNFTLEEMIYYILHYSDTAAMRILLGRYTAQDFAQYAAENLLLQYPEDIRNWMNARICALDAGVYMQAIYEYMEKGQYGDLLKGHLLQSEYPMIRSNYPVAHKYGWDVNAYHDMAVVYAPYPYILVVLTDKDMGTAAEYAMFGTIAGVFEEIMLTKR